MRVIAATAGEPDAALAEEIPVYFERALGEFSRRMSARVGEALQKHQARADSIIAAVRELASDLFAIDYAAPVGERAYTARREPYWVTHEWEVSPQPVEVVAFEAFLPKRVREARHRKRVAKSIERLVVSNVGTSGGPCSRTSTTLSSRSADRSTGALPRSSRTSSAPLRRRRAVSATGVRPWVPG